MDTFAIGTDGSKVTLQLKRVREHFIPFTYDTPGGFWAGLLHAAIQDEMKEMFRDIRSKAYDEGWKDARAKRRKADWFSGAFGRV